jgi:hypothetical protein
MNIIIYRTFSLSEYIYYTAHVPYKCVKITFGFFLLCPILPIFCYNIGYCSLLTYMSPDKRTDLITLGVLAFLMYIIAASTHNSWAPGSQVHGAVYLFTLKKSQYKQETFLARLIESYVKPKTDEASKNLRLLHILLLERGGCH